MFWDKYITEMAKIAVVIPCYKEHENILRLCDEVLLHVKNCNILIVDDSPDLQTVNAVAYYSHPAVKCIHRLKKDGRGSAVILGISEMLREDFDFILEIDADFSHPPSQINQLIEKASNEKLDLVIASRYLPTSSIVNWPASRRIFSLFANIVAKTVLRVPVSDYTNGFRLYSRAAAVEISSSCGKLGSGFIALSEILVNLHYRRFSIGELPTVFTNRVRGESSLSRKEIWNAIVGLKKIYFLKKSLLK